MDFWEYSRYFAMESTGYLLGGAAIWIIITFVYVLIKRIVNKDL